VTSASCRAFDMEKGELAVDFDGREVTYGFGELDELLSASSSLVMLSTCLRGVAIVRCC
jgi:hypothetical protein